MPSAANVSHEREREREREKDWLDVDALDEGRAVCGELRLANARQGFEYSTTSSAWRE